MTGETTKKAPRKQAGQPVLLSGGNPQIAKGYGDGPSQAYNAALPGWKSVMGRRLENFRQGLWYCPACRAAEADWEAKPGRPANGG